MNELDKERLKAILLDRLREARNGLPEVQADLSLWTAAVELWSQLNETAELAVAAAAQHTAQIEQQKLEALIIRLERGQQFLLR